MISKEFISELEEYYDLWSQDVYPDFVIEEFAVKELSQHWATEYDLHELLPENLIALIVKEGQSHLSADLRGGALTQLRNGELVNLSYMIPMYKRLFKGWEKRGWIKLERKVSLDKLKIFVTRK